MITNRLYANIRCPRCGFVGMAEVDVPLDGHGAVNDYSVGDSVTWNPTLYLDYPGRPPLGDLIADGYAVCSKCEKDYFVDVVVERDVIQRAIVNPSRRGYIPD